MRVTIRSGAVALAAGLALGGCRMERTGDGGEAPAVEAKGGELPRVEVESAGADVTVDTQKIEGEEGQPPPVPPVAAPDSAGA